MELGSTSTYKKVNSDCMSIINRHLDYMFKSGVDVCEQHERLPSFYWLPKLHKHHTEPGSLLPQIDVPLNSSRLCLHLALKP